MRLLSQNIFFAVQNDDGIQDPSMGDQYPDAPGAVRPRTQGTQMAETVEVHHVVFGCWFLDFGQKPKTKNWSAIYPQNKKCRRPLPLIGLLALAKKQKTNLTNSPSLAPK